MRPACPRSYTPTVLCSCPPPRRTEKKLLLALRCRSVCLQTTKAYVRPSLAVKLITFSPTLHLDLPNLPTSTRCITAAALLPSRCSRSGWHLLSPLVARRLGHGVMMKLSTRAERRRKNEVAARSGLVVPVVDGLGVVASGRSGRRTISGCRAGDALDEERTPPGTCP